jgi:type IV secretory pathway VirB2 component (pilin)
MAMPVTRNIRINTNTHIGTFTGQFFVMMAVCLIIIFAFSWYFGAMSRQDATDLLMAEREGGVFLVRSGLAS